MLSVDPFRVTVLLLTGLGFCSLIGQESHEPPPPPPLSEPVNKAPPADSFSIRIEEEIVSEQEAFLSLKRISVGLEASVATISTDFTSLGSLKRKTKDSSSYRRISLKPELILQLYDLIEDYRLEVFESRDSSSTDGKEVDITLGLDLGGNRYYRSIYRLAGNSPEEKFVEKIRSKLETSFDVEQLIEEKFSNKHLEGDILEEEETTIAELLFTGNYESQRIRLLGKLQPNLLDGGRSLVFELPRTLPKLPYGPTQVNIGNWSHFSKSEDLKKYAGKMVWITGVFDRERIGKDYFVSIRNITEIKVAQDSTAGAK